MLENSIIRPSEHTLPRIYALEPRILGAQIEILGRPLYCTPNKS